MTLAYIEWYKPFNTRDRDTQLFKVSPLTEMNKPKAEIIELGRILSNCHLIPGLVPTFRILGIGMMFLIPAMISC